MGRINIDYDKAMALARELDGAARTCDDAFRKLKTERGNSERCWQGLSGNAMRDQLDRAGKELNIQKGQLETIAANIRRVAEEMMRRDRAVGDMIDRFG